MVKSSQMLINNAVGIYNLEQYKKENKQKMNKKGGEGVITSRGLVIILFLGVFAAILLPLVNFNPLAPEQGIHGRSSEELMEVDLKTSFLGNWTATELVTYDGDWGISDPSFWIDNENNVHVTWHEAFQIYYKKRNNTLQSWSAAEIVQFNTSSSYPQISGDDFGNIYIIWMETSDHNGSGADTDVFMRTWNNSLQSWSNKELVSNDSNYDVAWPGPSIAVDGEGNIHVAYCEYDPPTAYIYYKSRNATTMSWTSRTLISFGDFSSAPTLAIDQMGNVHLMWQEQDPEIWYKYWNKTTDTWSLNARVNTQTLGNSFDMDFFVDDQGNVHFAWSNEQYNYSGSGLDFDIFYRFKNGTSGSFNPTELVSTGSTNFSLNPSICADSRGYVHVAWEDEMYSTGGNNYSIIYKYRYPSSGNWSSPYVASNDSFVRSDNPSILNDNDDNIHLIWTDGMDILGAGTDTDIFYKRLERVFNDFAPNLTNTGVSPPGGNQSTLFNFSATYSDQENNAPLSIEVAINGSKFTMDKCNVLDDNYTDGCDYQYLALLQPGTYEYSFQCNDGEHANSTNNSTLVVTETNLQAPSLQNASVTPAIGDNATNYTFSVMYYDLDNNHPEMINITINGTVFNMSALDPFDDNAMDGMEYVYSNSSLIWGNYSFNISCYDGASSNSTGIILGPEVNPFFGASFNLICPMNYSSEYSGSIQFNWTSLELVVGAVNYTWQISNESNFSTILNQTGGILETPTATNHVNDVNYPTGLYYWRVRPEFQGIIGNWSNYHVINLTMNDNSPTLTSENVTPPTGDQFTNFNFTIIYTDIDNNHPWSINVNINGTPYGMTATNPSDVNYTDGCEYQFTTALTPGLYGFFFETSDGRYSNATGLVTGLFVNETNSNSPTLDEAIVTPGTGLPNFTVFTFSVNYTDADNNAPQFLNVQINGIPYSMYKQNPMDTNYMDGCTYIYNTTLDGGTWLYDFNCSDGVFLATSGPYAGPNVTDVIFEDNFDSATLGAGWNWTREVPSNWSLTTRPGYMRITPESGDICYATNDAKNILLRDAPAGNYTIETRFELEPAILYNGYSACLMIYESDDHLAWISLGWGVQEKWYIKYGVEAGFNTSHTVLIKDLPNIYLRITKVGFNVSFFFSDNGLIWYYVDSKWISFTSEKVGIASFNGENHHLPAVSSDFDYFSIYTTTIFPYQEIDTDSDGMPNWWEEIYSFNSNYSPDGNQDADDDGLTNSQEYSYSTNPLDDDTDNDGVSDGVEVSQGSDPLDPSSMPSSTQPDADVMIILILAIIFGAVIIALTIYAKKKKKAPKEGKEEEGEEKCEEEEGDEEREEEMDKALDEIKEFVQKRERMLRSGDFYEPPPPPPKKPTMEPPIDAIASKPEIFCAYCGVKMPYFSTMHVCPYCGNKLILPRHLQPKDAGVKPKATDVEEEIIDIEKRQASADMMEPEVKVAKMVPQCVVHKGDITGLSYVCKGCNASYCIKCAKHLIEQGSPCWVCKMPIPDDLFGETPPEKKPPRKEPPKKAPPEEGPPEKGPPKVPPEKKPPRKEEYLEDIPVPRGVLLGVFSRETWEKINELETAGLIDDSIVEEVLHRLILIPPVNRIHYLEEVFVGSDGKST
ncbi:MAG: hypothetical protein ACFFCS_17615 [Candidatus Hodarchaeota archaeon]